MHEMIQLGPVGMLAAALLWMERERRSDRKRCDSDTGVLRGEIASVREAGERLHQECREELRSSYERLLGLVNGRDSAE